MVKENDMTGGTIAYVIRNHKAAFYYSENSLWLIDDWQNGIKDGSYFHHLNECEMDISQFSEQFLKDNLPQLILDFDQQKLINNFYDQMLENRVPKEWSGIWINDIPTFLALIPSHDRYWNDADFVVK